MYPVVLKYYVAAAPERSVTDPHSIIPVKSTMKKRTDDSRAINLFRTTKSLRGFTLTELLVVLAVFAILLGLTLPDYIKNRPIRLLNAETNRLAGTVRQARLYALRDNDKAYLEFIPEIDMYRLWTGQGWRAYADVINGPGEPPGRNPDIGDYDGDLDGDGDFWWGDGGDPWSPSGTPEDGRVKQGPNGWYYDLNDAAFPWDGEPLDPDALLMPNYPGNQPVRTISPKLLIYLDNGTGEITNIVRDLSDTGGISGESVMPLEVDLRMIPMTNNWAGSNTAPVGKRNGVLSHFPLLFMVFYPDGSVAASWDVAPVPDGFGTEAIDLKQGGLGAVQIHLQSRGNEYNPEASNLFNPSLVVEGDEGPSEPQSPYTMISLEDTMSDTFGRSLTINNLTGRIIIRNFRPNDLDKLHLAPTFTDYM